MSERAYNAQCLGRPRAAYDVAERAWAAAERGPSTKTGLRILGRSKLIELLTRHGIPWKGKDAGGEENGETGLDGQNVR